MVSFNSNSDNYYGNYCMIYLDKIIKIVYDSGDLEPRFLKTIITRPTQSPFR